MEEDLLETFIPLKRVYTLAMTLHESGWSHVPEEPLAIGNDLRDFLFLPGHEAAILFARGTSL